MSIDIYVEKEFNSVNEAMPTITENFGTIKKTIFKILLKNISIVEKRLIEDKIPCTIQFKKNVSKGTHKMWFNMLYRDDVNNLRYRQVDFSELTKIDFVYEKDMFKGFDYEKYKKFSIENKDRNLFDRIIKAVNQYAEKDNKAG